MSTRVSATENLVRVGKNDTLTFSVKRHATLTNDLSKVLSTVIGELSLTYFNHAEGRERVMTITPDEALELSNALRKMAEAKARQSEEKDK